jgi:hypothetical protein
MNEFELNVSDIDRKVEKVQQDIAGFREATRTVAAISDSIRALQEEFKQVKFGLAVYCQPRARVELPLSEELGGIFNYLIAAQKNPFDRKVIASQSSGDVVNIIDPNSTDNYSSSSGETEWIQFEFPQAISVNALRVQSAHRCFLRTWSFLALDHEGGRTELYSVVDDARLNGTGSTVLVNIRATSSKIFRLEKRGLNWGGETNFFRVKNIELFSEDPNYIGGVFKTLVGRVNDPHRAAVLVTTSNFDFQSYHLKGAKNSLCTLSDKEQPWIQWELVEGVAVVQGYRLEQLHSFLLEFWSLQASTDAVTWNILDRRAGEQGTALLRVFPVKSFTPWKYFRIVYEAPGEAGDIKLRIRHFDIFGVYLAVDSE